MTFCQWKHNIHGENKIDGISALFCLSEKKESVATYDSRVQCVNINSPELLSL